MDNRRNDKTTEYKNSKNPRNNHVLRPVMIGIGSAGPARSPGKGTALGWGAAGDGDTCIGCLL